LSPAEQAYLDAEERYDETDGGYSAIMGTRPDTVAAALVDSPAGLAGWLLDKYRYWSDCHGDLESRFDRDTLLTVVTLYWVTGAIGSSFRQYLDFPHNRNRPDITVPAAFTLSAEPGMVGFPRELAERACASVTLVSRDGVGFVPDPGTRLKAGDSVLIVATARVRDEVERRLRAVSRRGRLARWFGEYGEDRDK